MAERISRIQWHATTHDRLPFISRDGLLFPKQPSDVRTHRFAIPSISTANSWEDAAPYAPNGVLFEVRLEPGSKYITRSIRSTRHGETLEDSVSRWLREARERGADGVFVRGLQNTVGNQTINPEALRVVRVYRLVRGRKAGEGVGIEEMP